VQPRNPHEPVELHVLVSRGVDGRVVLRTPMTPGWSYAALTPAELARGIEQAFAECAIAAYARLRGVLYDLAETEEVIPPEAYARGRLHPAEPELVEQPVDEVATRRRSKHPKTHPPEEWVELDDGRWLSPKGRYYGPQTAIVASVRAARGT
jgi:hypothetical protein